MRATRESEKKTVKQTSSKVRSVKLKPVVRKKAVKPVAVKRAVSKSAVAKVTVVKKNVSKSDTVDAKKKTLDDKFNSEEVIILPDKISPAARLRERLLRMEIDQHLQQTMYKIAYGVGLCFVMVGAAYALLPQYNETFQISPQTAAVLNSIETDTTSMLEEAVVAPSTLTFLTTPPRNVIESVDVSFMVTNASNVTAKLVVVGVVGFIDVPIEKISGEKYKVTIKPEIYAANYYELRVYVKPSDGSSQYVRSTNKFFNGSEKIETWFNEQFREKPAEATETEANTDTEVTSSSTDPKVIIDNSESEPIVKIDDRVVVENTENEVSFAIKSYRTTTLAESVVLELLAPEDAISIELYARQSNSLSARFVTSAIKRQGQWVFAFDSKNLPNGSYEFFAKSLYKDQRLVTRSLTLTIQNSYPIPESKPIVQIKPSDTSIEPEKRFIEPIQVAESEVVYPQRTEAESKAENILQTNAARFDDLLQRYAMAVQTGDESLIRLAREALEREQGTIQLDLIADQANREIADRVVIELESQVTDIKKRIDSFEALRRERTSGESALDSDGDGISDHDENNLYGTDPVSADTDGDGVPDGVEIMTGLNPLVANAEAVIQYESPKVLIGLARPDVLVIEEVMPVVQAEASSSGALTAAEIRGRGLPNSFVTLFIFSTPTVVTVRTDADGMFVYTFDKELEDGEHDVYVAVTDNVGKIIAHSNPFSFIKEAQAFTPVDAFESDVAITNDVVVDYASRNAYSSTVGMAILALGIILLMLGLSLRKKETTVTEAESTGDTESPEPVLGANIRYKSDTKEHIDAT